MSHLSFRSGLVVALALSLSLVAPGFGEETRLIEGRSEWRYLVSESGPGTGWTLPTFNDSGWALGRAQLGYGDGDEETVVGYGGNSSNKFITTYYRRSFVVSDPSAFVRLDVALVRDDGAVIYLNGTEVLRSNMPAGEVNSSTLASAAQGGSEEDVFYYGQIDESLLVAGANVLSVEIHQSSPTSSDTSFDLYLSASSVPFAVTRGPYLQMGTPTAMTIRWRTDPASSSRIQYGTDPSLPWLVDDPAVVTEHEVRLVDLEPGTQYFYSVGTMLDPLTSTVSPLSFRTAPDPGVDHATRIWVIGDAGTSDLSQARTLEAYRAYNGDRPTDLWLMLGDNAYDDGSDVEFQTAVFEMYKELLAASVVWPTLGNHDGVAASSASQSGPYYDMFTLPTAGEGGGEASGTEAYYSFDYANIHFICLESFETSRSLASPMMTWLEDDIAGTDADWVIAFWHHPPYTKGSHDSDSSIESVEMRENALPILEEFGVDLVLTGHSHSYERSFLLDGHYDSSDTLLPGMVLDAGDGDADGAYAKPTAGPAPHEGAVYLVAGSSGRLAGGSLDHPVMVTSQLTLGTLVIDVDRLELSVMFLDDQAQIADGFKMTKAGGNPAAVPDLAVISPGVSSATLVVDGSFTASATVKNQGDAPAGATTLRYYLSIDATISGADTLLGSDSVTTLAPSETASLGEDVNAPSSPGTYWVGACVDPVGGEISLSNQCSIGVEVLVEDSNVLFADGFESGDTSAWEKTINQEIN